RRARSTIQLSLLRLHFAKTMKTRYLILLASGLLSAMVLFVPLQGYQGLKGKTGDWPTAFECRFTELPIKIDGKGDDEAWKHAQTIDTFYTPWPGEKGKPGGTKTKAQALWDPGVRYVRGE